MRYTIDIICRVTRRLRFLSWQVKSLAKEAISLHIVLTIVLACLTIIFTLVLIILLVPLHYKLDLHFNQPGLQSMFLLHNCCYGLQFIRQEKKIILQLRLLGFSRPLKQPSPADKSVQPAKPAPTRKKSLSLQLLKELVQDFDWKEHIGGFVKGIWRIIHPHSILVKARIGFSEPHYTGWLMALAGFLQAMNHSYIIHLDGVWDEPCLEGEISLAGRLILVQLVWQLLKFILKPEIRSAYKRLRAQKISSPQRAAA